ncbi:gfo/Idh/MocA family oxidoreductase, partial [bacterium]|nr:gfo/Idh/MocA family oxidoreductase [bacterium]
MSKTHRRDFIQSSAIAISGFSILSAQSAFTASANSKMAVGVIGCGGRGNYDARNFRRHTDSRIVALADIFEDRLAFTKNRFEDDSPATYQGFDAYQKVLDSDIDAVIITSPPYFHPDQFEATIAAKKHVY